MTTSGSAEDSIAEIASPFEQVTQIPHHVAIIMDGNGRWARERGWHRSIGHAQGSARVKEIIREADHLGIEVLTLFCFSTENWNRPSEEIAVLMDLLRDYLLQERQELVRRNIRFQVFGQVERISPVVREILVDTIESTRNNTGLILNFCMSYGGRAELVRAVQSITQQVAEGTLQISDVSEELISKHLYTTGLPDPDLVIRTSGEYRLSNFLLWQSAYSEIYVTQTFWPDFEPSHLRAACQAFAQRKRRFGR